MSTAALSINLVSTEEKQKLFNKYDVVPNASYPVHELRTVNFKKYNDIENPVVIPNNNEKTIYSKQISSEGIEATCFLTHSFNSTSKITVQISCSDELYKFGDIHPHNIFSDIILCKNENNDNTPFFQEKRHIICDHLSPYFFDVYRDCYVHDKQNYDKFIEPFENILIEGYNNKIIDITSITLPLPFYFERQKAKLDVTVNNYAVKFILSKNFVESHQNIIDTLSVKLLVEATIDRGQHDGINKIYAESIEPFYNVSLTKEIYQCFNVDVGILCKNMYFAIYDKKHGKYATSKIVSKVLLCHEMATFINMSIRHVTITQHYHEGLIQNENHIFIPYGSSKFNNTFDGACIPNLANVSFSLTFKEWHGMNSNPKYKMDDDRYELVGFRTVIKEF